MATQRCTTTSTPSRPMWTMTTVTRRTPTSTSTTCARSEHACTLLDVLSSSHLCHTHIGSSRLLSLSSHLHTIHDERFSLSCSTSSFYLSLHFLVFFLSFLSMYSVDFDSVTDNLRDSANGTFVTSDDTFPLTGYEPNDMELNDTRIPSSTLLRHQTTTWMTRHSASYSLKYTEITPITAVWEGVCVSPSSMSVMVGRTGKPVEKSDIDQFGFSVRNMYSAQNQFLAITQTERMVDRTGETCGRNHWNC